MAVLVVGHRGRSLSALLFGAEMHDNTRCRRFDLIEAANLTPSQKAFLWNLNAHQGDLPGFYHSLNQWGQKLGIKDRRTIQSLVRSVEKIGCVEITSRGQNDSFIYSVIESGLVAQIPQGLRAKLAETYPDLFSSDEDMGNASDEDGVSTSDEDIGTASFGDKVFSSDEEQKHQKHHQKHSNKSLDEKAPSGSVAPIPPKTSCQNQGVATTEEDWEVKDRQILKTTAASLEALERRYSLKKSFESYEDLARTFREKVRAACYAVFKERGWPCPVTGELLRRLAQIVGDEDGEYSGNCSWGLVFKDLDRLARAIEDDLIGLEDYLYGKAAQVSRGHATIAELASDHSPAELAYVQREADRIIAYNKRRAEECEREIAATMATLPPAWPPPLTRMQQLEQSLKEPRPKRSMAEMLAEVPPMSPSDAAQVERWAQKKRLAERENEPDYSLSTVTMSPSREASVHLA